MKKRILATFLSAVTLISCSSALAADYSDVNQSAWYASYVNKISDKKMVRSDLIIKLHKKNL